MAIVRDNANQIIEFRKQRLIHGVDAIEYIASAVSEFKDFINDLDVPLRNLSKIKLSDITKEDIEMARDVVKKLNNAGTELNVETVTKIIKDAAKFDIDKAAQDIIDAKNKEIEELKRKLSMVEGSNIIEFKKESDK